MSAGRTRGVHGMELLYALVYIIAVDVGKRQTEIVANADLILTIFIRMPHSTFSLNVFHFVEEF